MQILPFVSLFVGLQYRPSIFLNPESMAWFSAEQLIVNMQPNNGMVRINVTSGEILDVAGYGLRNHAQIPVDINRHDKACDLQTYKHLFAMRQPDGISTLRYNDKIYIFSANEGTDFEYDEFIENRPAESIFQNTSFGLANMEVPKR